MILPFLVIAPSPSGGRGVFTTANISAGTTVEISPVLVFNAEERAAIEQTNLYNYIFEWDEDKQHAALGMGYISMYNHSFNANCDYQMDYEHDTMSITTLVDVPMGEELFINYNGTYNDNTPLWFNAK